MISKFRSAVLVCIASLLLASCSGTSTNYTTNRLSFNGYQELLTNFDKQMDRNGFVDWNNDLGRWWDCESYGSDSYYLETENEEPWKLFGYCLSSIDVAINQYLWLKVYKKPEHLDDASITLLKNLNPNSKQSINKFCLSLVTEEIDNNFKGYSQGNKNLKYVSGQVNAAIISGCILRFTEMLNLQIKWAKLGIMDQQARVKVAEEEESLEIEDQMQFDQEANTNSQIPSSGKWERKCKNVTTTTTGERLEIIDGRIQGGPITTITKVCEDVWVP